MASTSKRVDPYATQSPFPIPPRHGAAVEAQVLAACREPGALVSAVAIAHGLNTNFVRKWLQGRSLTRAGLATASGVGAAAPTVQFVPVT